MEYTCLHKAARAGLPEVVHDLIECGANIEATTVKMRTPLHTACIYGKSECVEVLLEKKADPHAIEEAGLSPLHIAAQKDDISSMRRILDHSNIIDFKSDRNDVKTMFEIITDEKKYNKRFEERRKMLAKKASDRSGGYTPLHCAAKLGKLASVEWLLKNDANPYIFYENNFLPIHMAIKGYHEDKEKEMLEVINIFLDFDHHFIRRQTKTTRDTNMSLAIKSGDKQMMKLLIDRGAKLSRRAGQRFIPPLNIVEEEMDRLIEEDPSLEKGEHCCKFSNTEMCSAKQLSNLLEVKNILTDFGAVTLAKD